ncbi:MAG: hypothetical protein PHQ42_04230 [Patescibacteria group bacterium]|nr:hypothetical protein [Patescibacteria group bacterium]
MKSVIKQSYLELLNQNIRIINTNLEIIEDLNQQAKTIGTIWLLDVLTLYSDDVVLRIYKILESGGNKNSIPNIIKNITCVNKKSSFNNKAIHIKKTIDDAGLSDSRNNLIAHSDRDKDNAGFWGTRLIEEDIQKIKEINKELNILVGEINLEFGNNQFKLDRYDYLIEQYKAFLGLVVKCLEFRKKMQSKFE